MKTLLGALLLVLVGLSLSGPASAQDANATYPLKSTHTLGVTAGNDCSRILSNTWRGTGRDTCYWGFTSSIQSAVFDVVDDCGQLDFDPDARAGQTDNGNKLTVYRVVSDPAGTVEGSWTPYVSFDGTDTKVLPKGRYYFDGDHTLGTGLVVVTGLSGGCS